MKATDGSAASPEQAPRWGHAIVEMLAVLTAELASVRQVLAALEDRTAEREMLVRPFLVDLQRLRDDLVGQAKALQTADNFGEATSGQVVELLESFAYSVEQTLARGGIELVRPEVGSPFDASRHRAAGVLPTTRADQDGTVAEVVSEGYVDTTTDRTLLTAAVRVYRRPRPNPDPS